MTLAIFMAACAKNNMKYTLLLTLLFSFSFTVLAEYEPFVVEGKMWEVEYRGNWNGWTELEILMLNGDTLINGQTYKKMYGTPQNSGDVIYKGAFRELDRKVYFLPSSAHEEVLYYDFTLHVGDTYTLFMDKGTAYESECQYEVYVDDTLYTCEHALHRLGLFYPNEELTYIGPNIYSWIEGVGSKFGPEFCTVPSWTGSNVYLLSCRICEQYLYRNTDVKVESLSPNPSPIGRGTLGSRDDALYDLQGRRLSGEGLPKGIYIQGGKKRIIR